MIDLLVENRMKIALNNKMINQHLKKLKESKEEVGKATTFLAVNYHREAARIHRANVRMLIRHSRKLMKVNEMLREKL